MSYEFNDDVSRIKSFKFSSNKKKHSKIFIILPIGLVVVILTLVVSILYFYNIGDNPIKYYDTVEDAVQYNGHYYKGFPEGVSWIEAEQKCNNMGGHLISINSQEEMDVALLIAKELNKDNIWIGGKRNGDLWEWSDGSEFIYQNWDKREVINFETNKTIVYEQPDNYDGEENYIRFVSRYIEYPENSWWANEGKWNDTANNGDSDAPLNSFGYICEWN